MIMESTPPSWEQRLFALAEEARSSSRDSSLTDAQNEDERLLQAAYAICAEITAQHSRSFYLASSLLPGDKRRTMRALYAFCRTVDNVVDGKVEHPEIKLCSLRESILGGRPIDADPVLTAWTDARLRYQIPLRYAEQLIDGVARDLVSQRYPTFEDLSVYCYGVASTVGLMSMYITGFSDQQAVPYAIKLGVALQLTNILRDVGEDWHTGRFYLPLDELTAFGLDEQEIANGVVDERWRAFMRYQISRTRRLYQEAIPGIEYIHRDGRFAVSAAATLYMGILDDIEAHDYDVFNRRAFTNRGAKLSALLRAYWHSKKLPVH